MLDFSYILYLLMQALAVIVGLCVHESAHALAAWALGDKTARSRGRVCPFRAHRAATCATCPR